MNDESTLREPLSLDALRRINELTERFEAALADGQPALIEDFLLEMPEAVRVPLFRELLLAELEFRRERNEKPDEASYRERFPNFQESLRSVFVESEKPSEADRFPFLLPSENPKSLGRLGHFEILEVLGQGGFGTVFKAFDEQLHRVVAIKVIAAQLATTSPPRKRFLREARAAAAIHHEQVVQIFGVEEHPIPHIVMEYIAGETLQQRLDRTGPLDVPEVIRIGHLIASGLAAAHEQHLVHRDIKPDNILLESALTQRVKISDFGLARAADDASLTQSGLIAGTPFYMAPEQAQGEAIDHRTDLFSFGSVLYVMCTGRPPFRAATPIAVLKRVVEETPRPIQEIIPEIPTYLVNVISRLHAKNPNERFQSAQEVANLLLRAHEQLQRTTMIQNIPLNAKNNESTIRLHPVTGQPMTAQPMTAQAAIAQPTSLRKRIKPAVAVALIAVFCLVTAAALGWTTWSSLLAKWIKPSESPVVVQPPPNAAPISEEPAEVVPGEIARVEGGHYKIIVSPLGDRAYGGGDDFIHVWKMPELKEVTRFTGHSGAVHGLAISPDGKHLVSGGQDNSLRHWDAVKGVELQTFAEHGGPAFEVAISPDSRFAYSACYDGKLRCFDLVEKREVYRREAHQGVMRGLSLSSDGTRILTCGFDGAIQLWDSADGQQIRQFNPQPEVKQYIHVEFSRDDRSALSCGFDKFATLWDVETGTEKLRLRGHTQGIHDVSFSADGQRVLTGGLDKTIRLWDANSGDSLHTFFGHTEPLGVALFANDNRFALSAAGEKSVRLWRLPNP